MEPKERSQNSPFPHVRAKSSEKALRVYKPIGEEYESDRLIAKLSYLDWLARVFEQYEQSSNLRIIKKFVAANSRRFRTIIDELNQYKENIPGREDKEFLRGHLSSQIQQLVAQNQKLDDDYRMEQQRQSELDQRSKDDQQHQAAQQQLSNLEATIAELKKEIEETERRNLRLRQGLNRFPFFQEYELMCKEIEGVLARNQKLRRLLQARKSQAVQPASQSKVLRLRQ